MIIQGWKTIAPRIGKSPRWCQRWLKSRSQPSLPVAFVNGRVEASCAQLDAWRDAMLDKWQCRPEQSDEEFQRELLGHVLAWCVERGP